MIAIISIAAPVFALIAIGYLAAQIRLVGRDTDKGLADYVFAIAVPALIFTTISESEAPLSSSPWGFWITYFSAAAIAWILGMLSAGRIFGRSWREAVIHGFCSAQSNTVFMGIPLILRAYGDDGAVPLFLLLAVHLPIMMTAAAIMIESAESDQPRATRIWRFVKTLLTHPILLALLAGLVAHFIGFRASGVARTVLDGLMASASPAALISMGLALARHGFRSDPAAASVSSFFKLLLHPFLVWVIGVHLFALEPVFVGVAVLFAAVPSGINGYLIAVRYRTGEAFASNAVTISTAASVATIPFWLWWLGV